MMKTSPARTPNARIVTPRPMIAGEGLGAGACGSCSAAAVVSSCPDTRAVYEGDWRVSKRRPNLCRDVLGPHSRGLRRDHRARHRASVVDRRPRRRSVAERSAGPAGEGDRRSLLDHVRRGGRGARDRGRRDHLRGDQIPRTPGARRATVPRPQFPRADLDHRPHAHRRHTRGVVAAMQDANRLIDPLTKVGHDTFLSLACVGCHTVKGTTAGGKIGPELTHVASQKSIAGGVLSPVDEANLTRWIKDPPAVKPGTKMPNYNLSDQQIHDIVQWLLTLK